MLCGSKPNVRIGFHPKLEYGSANLLIPSVGCPTSLNCWRSRELRKSAFALVCRRIEGPSSGSEACPRRYEAAGSLFQRSHSRRPEFRYFRDQLDRHETGAAECLLVDHRTPYPGKGYS